MPSNKESINEWVLQWLSIYCQCNTHLNKWVHSNILFSLYCENGHDSNSKSFIRVMNKLCNDELNNLYSSRIFDKTKKLYINYYMISDGQTDPHLINNYINDLQQYKNQIENSSVDTDGNSTDNCSVVSSNENFIDDQNIPSLQIPQIQFLIESFKYTTNSRIATSYILSSLHLDFVALPRKDIRPNCINKTIPIENKIEACEMTKWHCCLKLAKCEFGKLKKSEKRLLCQAVGKKEAYLCGYLKPFGWSTVLRWWDAHEKNERQSNDVQKTFRSNRKRKRLTYIESLQDQFPDFLHGLYRYASKTLGHNTNNFKIRHLMMKKAKLLHPNCPIRSKLELTTHHFRQFFKLNGGHYKSLSTKPRLTDENIKARNIWARKYISLIQDDTFYYCFLDEKWFFCNSNRKKYKILPPNKEIGETEADAYVPRPRVRSRRKPCKVMYIACVAQPVKEKKFDGRILMERVSEYVKAEQMSHAQRFSNDYKINNLIKEGMWKNLYVLGVKPQTLFESIQEYFNLDDYTCDRLVITYATYAKTLKTKYVKHIDMFDSETKGKGKTKRLVYNERELLGDHRMIRTKDGVYRKLTLDDCKLEVQTLKGMLVEKDTTCDSTYMMGIIHNLGRSIRSAFHWLPKKTVPIHLFMDNAGGYGTELTKLEYIEILQKKYNVIVDWHCPNSPETNVLDLGIWCIIQSNVEYMHKYRRMTEDPLAESVAKAWNYIDSAKSSRWLLIDGSMYWA